MGTYNMIGDRTIIPVNILGEKQANANGMVKGALRGRYN